MVSGAQSTQYLDLGRFQSWNMMQGNQIDMTKFNAYLDSFAAECKQQGVTATTLSFVQVCDIGKLASGDFADMSHSDSLWMMNTSMGGAKANGESAFEYMVKRLKADGIGVNLSIGGMAATASDWDFGFGSNSPSTLASQLANWAHSMGLSNIDFDVETNITSAPGNTSSNLAAFFADFHADTAKDNISTTLTLMGDINQWGPNGAAFADMFADAKQNGKTFTDLFDGVNLMLYSDTQYYLNVNTSSPTCWSLASWVKEIMGSAGVSAKDAASLIHIGFLSNINYDDTSSSAYQPPEFVPPSGLSSGAAAAYIFDQINKALGEAFGDSSLKLGSPFFWSDNADYDIAANGDSEFYGGTDNFELDFNSYFRQQESQKHKGLLP